MRTHWPKVLSSALLGAAITFGTGLLALLAELPAGAALSELSGVALLTALIGALVSAAKDVRTYLAAPPRVDGGPEHPPARRQGGAARPVMLWHLLGTVLLAALVGLALGGCTAQPPKVDSWQDAWTVTAAQAAGLARAVASAEARGDLTPTQAQRAKDRLREVRLYLDLANRAGDAGTVITAPDGTERTAGAWLDSADALLWTLRGMLEETSDGPTSRDGAAGAAGLAVCDRAGPAVRPLHGQGARDRRAGRGRGPGAIASGAPAPA